MRRWVGASKGMKMISSTGTGCILVPQGDAALSPGLSARSWADYPGCRFARQRPNPERVVSNNRAYFRGSFSWLQHRPYSFKEAL